MSHHRGNENINDNLNVSENIDVNVNAPVVDDDQDEFPDNENNNSPTHHQPRGRRREREDNPFTITVIRLSKTLRFRVDLLLFNIVGPKFLKIDHPEDILTWIESDEVCPFFEEFRWSWLDQYLDGQDFNRLVWLVWNPPNVDEVYRAIRGDYTGTGTGIAATGGGTRAGKFFRYLNGDGKWEGRILEDDFRGPVRGASGNMTLTGCEKTTSQTTTTTTNLGFLRGGGAGAGASWKRSSSRCLSSRVSKRRKRRWKGADHWAWFCLEVYDRAADKVDGSTGAGTTKEFPSLWPGAEGLFGKETIRALVLLLHCLVMRFLIRREEEVSLEKALEREVMELD